MLVGRTGAAAAFEVGQIGAFEVDPTKNFKTKSELLSCGVERAMGRRMSDNALCVVYGLRLIDRRVADALNHLPEGNRYVRGLIRWLGFRHTEVRYRRAGRFAGETKYPYTKLIGLALDGITSFSTFPLRLVAYLGFAVSLLSLFLVAFAFYGLAVGPTPEGWTSVFVAVVFLSGVQLVAIGVLGAYVSRIFQEVKGRPLNVVASDTARPAARDARP